MRTIYSKIMMLIVNKMLHDPGASDLVKFIDTYQWFFHS